MILKSILIEATPQPHMNTPYALYAHLEICIIHARKTNSHMYVPQVHPQLTLSFFDSVWFVFVTVSTVGYGDFSPRRYVGEKKIPVVHQKLNVARLCVTTRIVYGSCRDAKM